MRWFRMTVTPLRGSDRQVLVSHRNVTSAKRAQSMRSSPRHAPAVDRTGSAHRAPEPHVLMHRLEFLLERTQTDPDFGLRCCFSIWPDPPVQ